jgi:hypothetical protein
MAINLTSRFGALIAGITIMGSVFAAQPSDVVPSDSQGNTAMGNVALGSTAIAANLNTAAGAYSLTTNETHGGNSAFGWRALSAAEANENSAFRTSALGFDTSGESNTALGWSAMAVSWPVTYRVTGYIFR